MCVDVHSPGVGIRCDDEASHRQQKDRLHYNTVERWMMWWIVLIKFVVVFDVL